MELSTRARTALEKLQTSGLLTTKSLGALPEKFLGVAVKQALGSEEDNDDSKALLLWLQEAKSAAVAGFHNQKTELVEDWLSETYRFKRQKLEEQSQSKLVRAQEEISRVKVLG